jgi:tripartite-type tricarboxylate transporter receptor subunit TctC
MLIPLLYPEKTYNYRSLQPIAWFAYAPNVVVVRSDSSFKTLQELLDFAKKNPGKLNYGSTGATHISRVSMELIKKGAGVDMVHVPFQGGGPLKTAILGGHVDVACDSIVAVNPLIKAGNLRALAICSGKRHDELPQVATVSELGYPNASLPVRAGYMAPLGTPQPIINKWNQAIQKALADPAVIDQLKKASLTLDYIPLEAMTKAMDGPSQILTEWVKEGGLTKK